tara:strand:+ start:4599 stop:6695 length:2097 start_codon:yes stop_codon:yes gene_type:complete
MNNVKKLAVVFALFSFVSCMDEDLSNVSNTLEIQPNMAIPIIHSTTTLVDLLPEDENMSFDDDGLIRIIYKEDSIAQVSSDTLLVIEDQAPTPESFTIGAIDIGDFETDVNVTLSELISNLNNTVSDQMNIAINLAESNNSLAWVPSILSQSGGEYQHGATDELDFEFVLISEGALNIEITNNFGFEIFSLLLELRNAANQNVIGQFSYNSITAGTSQIQSINLDNNELYSDLEIDIVEFSSIGSCGTIADVPCYLPISGSDDMIFTISGSSIQATSGSVKFPEQEGPSDSLIVDMQLDDGVEISHIDLSSGVIAYDYESSVNAPIELIIEIPSLINNQTQIPFSYTLEIINNTEGSGFLPIDNYFFDLSESENEIKVNYLSQIPSTINYVDFNENDEIQIYIGLEDLDFSYVEGYFGQINQEIEEDELDIDLSVIEDIASGIYLETPNLRFTVDNAIGVPLEINLDLIGVNDNETLSLMGPNSPNIQAQGLMSSFTDYNNTNSQLSDLIAMSPSQIIYSGSVVSNPSGNMGVLNSISSESVVSIGFEMDLPLHLRIEDAITTDTLALDFANENDDNSGPDYVDSVILKLHTENEFPLDIDLMILFTDSVSGLVLDSLDVELLDGAEVDEDGRTISANIYDSNIILNSGQIDALFNSNRALLEIKINSYDNQNTAVKLYTDYEFKIAVGAILELNIEE